MCLAQPSFEFFLSFSEIIENGAGHGDFERVLLVVVKSDELEAVRAYFVELNAQARLSQEKGMLINQENLCKLDKTVVELRILGYELLAKLAKSEDDSALLGALFGNILGNLGEILIKLLRSLLPKVPCPPGLYLEEGIAAEIAI